MDILKGNALLGRQAESHNNEPPRAMKITPLITKLISTRGKKIIWKTPLMRHTEEEKNWQMSLHSLWKEPASPLLEDSRLLYQQTTTGHTCSTLSSVQVGRPTRHHSPYRARTPVYSNYKTCHYPTIFLVWLWPSLVHYCELNGDFIWHKSYN